MIYLALKQKKYLSAHGCTITEVNQKTAHIRAARCILVPIFTCTYAICVDGLNVPNVSGKQYVLREMDILKRSENKVLKRCLLEA